jgi:hypothetical protein
MTGKEIKEQLAKVDPMRPNKYVPPVIRKMHKCIKNREVTFCNECIKCDEGDGCPLLLEALSTELPQK